LRPTGSWELELPSALQDLYSQAYGRYAFAVLDADGKVMFSSLKDQSPVFSQAAHAADAAFLHTRKGDAVMSGVSLPKAADGRTVWIQVGEDMAHRDVIVDDIVADFFKR